MYLPGTHSILIDQYTSSQRAQLFGNTGVIDNKYKLPVFVDNRSSICTTNTEYTTYHIGLQNDNPYRNFGIYANGLLVESGSLIEFAYYSLF